MMTGRPPDLAIVLDCADPEALASFWAGALGYTIAGTAGSYVMLVHEAGTTPPVLLQRVDEPKTGKNRMHLDIHTADVRGEVTRLQELGARRVDDVVHEEHGGHWVVMTDPEGNEFCVCDAGCC